MLTIVVGSRGYLGSALTSAFKRDSFDFRGLVRKKKKDDLCELEYLGIDIFKDLQSEKLNIVYCALDSHKDYGLKNADKDLSNITSFLFELEKKKIKVDRFLYLSSHAIYSGNESSTCTVNEPIAIPENPYAFMKILSEKLVLNACMYKDWSPIILRCGAILGRNSSGNFLSKFLFDQKEKKTSVWRCCASIA